MSVSSQFKNNSPEGMGQLIRYFESQSQRLDKQSIVPPASSFNADFESMIKFNGVPILPPAMTSGRREELRQVKKNAILLEKRLKIRQNRQKAGKHDSSQMTYPETSPRPTARQLNFDSESLRSDAMPERFGATNPLGTLSGAEYTSGTEDFGLQTMDSVNSDFMSMEQGSVPKVFAGLALESFKEQKISYDLDRLSKVLNVQDMASTSGSDLSDALGNTQQLDEDELQDAHRYAQKFLHSNNNNSSVLSQQTAGFFHESQDTVVEVSPGAGSVVYKDTSSKSDYADPGESSNLEQTVTSVVSSPGCGSANTTATESSQRSNRGSPKSLKSGVHFASFLTEYKTTTSQLFERPVIVKKKMPHEFSKEQISSGVFFGGSVPIIGHPSDTRFKNSQKAPGEEDETNPMLNRVIHAHDSDMSPITPPLDAACDIPFQSYGKSEHHNSDKENDASHGIHKMSSVEISSSSNSVLIDSSKRWSVHKTTQGKDSHSGVLPEAGNQDSRNDDSRRKSPSTNTVKSKQDPSSLLISGVSSGVGPQELPSFVDQVGASPLLSLQQKDEPPEHIFLPGRSSETSGVGKISVCISQDSTKSSMLASDSCNSTIKDDLHVDEITNNNLSMNIVVTGHGSVDLSTGKTVPHCDEPDNENDQDENHNKTPPKKVPELSNSPIKLNTDIAYPVKQNPSEDNADDKADSPPPRQFIRKGSYTLSEPSPALLRARAKQQELIGSGSKQDNEMGHAIDHLNIGVEPQIDICDRITKQDETVSSVTVDVDQHVQRKLPDVNTNVLLVHTQDSTSSDAHVSPAAEQDGKNEHMNKYLSQVHLQRSMNLSYQSWDPSELQMSSTHEPATAGIQVKDSNGADRWVTQEDDVTKSLTEHSSFTSSHSLADVLKSLSESIQISGENTPISQLLSLHQQQMDCERQSLITQQQRDMEELFVQQRRDMLLLEAEIKAAQQMEKDQADFLIQNLPENIKVAARNHVAEFSPLNSANIQQQQQHNTGGDGYVSLSSQTNVRSSGKAPDAAPGAIHSMDNRRQQANISRSLIAKPNHPENINIQPKSFPDVNKPGHKVKKTIPHSKLKKSKVSPYSPRSAWEESQTTYVKTLDDSFSPRGHPSPIVVPSLNTSSSSPHIHQSTMLRSPLKARAMQRKEGKVTIPPEVYTAEMQEKFDKVSAVAKGFLTRCLLRSDKVQELVKTIKDTREFAFTFQSETPVKKGVFTSQDRTLLERIVAQLQAALLDIHEIFFEVSCSERMALIEQTRNKEHDKRVNMSRDNLRGSGPRMSQATLKALERKKKAKEAEASVSASMSRPHTAPSMSNSPRGHTQTDLRALKPLHSQSHHYRKPDVSVPGKQDTNRYDKDRPRTAPAKPLTKPKRITALTIKHSNSPSNTSADISKDSIKDGANKPNATTASKVVTKSKANTVKPAPSRPGKSWR